MSPILLNLGCGPRHHPDWINVDMAPGEGVIPYDLAQGIPFGEGCFDVVYHSHFLEHLTWRLAPTFLSDCFRVLKPGGIIRVVVPDLETIARLYLLLLEKSLKGDVIAQQRYEWIMLELLDQMVRNHSGGAMLEYWQQKQMPAENFVIERLGSEAKDAITKIRSNPNSENQHNGQHDNTLNPLEISQFRLSGEIHQWMYDRYSLGKLLKDAGFEDIKLCRANESRIPNFNNYFLDIETDGSVRKPDSLFMEASKPNLHAANSKFTHTQIKNATNSRVAHFCMQDFGGAGTAALRLHLGLLMINFDSTFYVMNSHKWSKNTVLLTDSPIANQHGKKISSPEWTDFLEKNNQRLSAYPHRPKDLEMFSTLWAAPSLDEIPALKHADIIHFHWIAGTVCIPANIEFLKKKKIVWTLHDMNPFTGGCHYAGDCNAYRHHCGACPQLGSNKDNDLSFEIWYNKNRAYRQLDITVITPSRWLGECAKTSSLFSTFPVHTIPYGLPTDIFNPTQRSEMRARMKISPDTFVVLFGADVLHNKRKGFKHILETLKILKSTGQTNIILATFGRSKNIPLEDIGYPTISFDYVDNEFQLASIYNMADVTLIPSLEDNLPNIVLESMACGTPVVGFNVGGIPDMITHLYNGYLAKLGDASDLANGVIWVRENKKINKIIRTKCRETVLSKYNILLQSNSYVDIYK